MKTLRKKTKLLLFIILFLTLAASALIIETPALSCFGVTLSLIAIFVLLVSGTMRRLFIRHKRVKIIKNTHPIIGKVLLQREMNNNIVVLQIEYGEKGSRNIASVCIDKRDSIFGAPDEYFSLSVGKSAQFYLNPQESHSLIAPLRKIKYINASEFWDWISERWWIIFPLLGPGLAIYGLVNAFSPNYSLECLQYVSANRETIWEMKEYSKNSDENPGGTYKITIYDAKSGKKIKKIKRKYHTKIEDFSIVQTNKKVWVIGRAYDHEPVVDVYDANTYKTLDMLGSLQSKFPALESGIISGEIIKSIGKIHDNMYGQFFTLPGDRILELKTAGATTCYLDITTEKFYETDKELYWNLCLSGYSMIESYGKYIYYLIYETDSSTSKLYQGTPPEPGGGYFYNTYPQSLDNEYQQQYREYIGLKEFTYSHNLKNAKIVYQDIDVLCVFHNTPDKNTVYRITCFNHNGDILAEIDLSKFKNYSFYENEEIRPYSIREDNWVKFRIKYLGSVSYNVESNQIKFQDDGQFPPKKQQQHLFIVAEKGNNNLFNLYHTTYTGDDIGLYYNDLSNYNSEYIEKIDGIKKLLNDRFFRNASIIYQNGKFVLVFYCHVPGDNNQYRIAAIDYTGKELFAIEKDDFPNADKFEEEFKRHENYSDYAPEIEAKENNNSVILIFEKLGVLGVNVENGSVLWKYKVKL